MATENPRVWFKSISLENVRSFGTKQTINFTDENGNAARWNVILGDNGTGKTTALNSVIISIETDLFNVGFNTYHYFSRNKSRIESKIFLIDEEYNQVNNVKPISKKIGLHIRYMQGSILPERILPDPDVNRDYITALNRGNLFAYGASRKMSRSLITESRNRRSLLSDEEDELVNAEEWLVQVDYLGLKNYKLKYKYDLVKRILLQLFKGEAHDIHISIDSGFPEVIFKTHYGEVGLRELSLGYKTLISWIVDFANGLFDSYPNSKNPLAEPAVCLVDEIDLHLHPKFQRNIIKFLTETFPNTQFIVTAHSPLIVVAAEERPLDANIILLKREGDQTVVVNDPVDVSKWSVDQILNSDLFGHVPPRSEQLNELRSERDKLLAKTKLTKKDNTRLVELDEKIGFVPFGQDQAEIQSETIIQQLADVLRKQQQVP